MANNIIPLFDDEKDSAKSASPVIRQFRDEDLDLGEGNQKEKRRLLELTPEQVELQINAVQERERAFDQTALDDPEQKFLGEKTYQTKQKLIHVQHGTFEEPEEKAEERILEKFKIVLDNLLRKMISAKKRYPELLGKLSDSLDSETNGEKLELLDELQESLRQLRFDLRSVAHLYFSEGVRMINEFRSAYRKEFRGTMKPRVDEYYLRFGHTTDHIPSPDLFVEILVTDIVNITSGHYTQNSLNLDKLDEKISRLIKLLKEQESNSDASSKIISFDDRKRQEEVVALTDELKEQQDIFEEENVDDSDRAVQAA